MTKGSQEMCEVLNFSKDFGNVSCSILTDKLASTQLDKSIVWVSNCLMGWAQRVALIWVQTDWYFGLLLYNAFYKLSEHRNQM